MKLMAHHWSLLIFDAVCISLMSIHLTDMDLALKLIASGLIVVSNIIIIRKNLKK